MKVKLTKNDAQEVIHKLGVLADTEDLRADYKLTQIQADQLRDSVPFNGGEWVVPEWAIEAVKGEMQDHAVVLRCIADNARDNNAIGESLAIHRQAKKFEETFE